LFAWVSAFRRIRFSRFASIVLRFFRPRFVHLPLERLNPAITPGTVIPVIAGEIVMTAKTADIVMPAKAGIQLVREATVPLAALVRMDGFRPSPE